MINTTIKKLNTLVKYIYKGVDITIWNNNLHKSHIDFLNKLVKNLDT